MNIKDTLTKEDIRKWAKNLFIFSMPAILAFLMALQTGGFTFALGAFYSAFLAGLIDLFGKYKSGVDPKDTFVPYVTTSTKVVEPVKEGE